MALITKPSTIEKGQEYTLSLSKAELFQIAEIAADSYFSNPVNVQYCVIEYNSDPGNQREYLKFDLSQASPQAVFGVSVKARTTFLLEKIVLKDFDGGTLTVYKANVPAGNDIVVS